MAKQTPAFSNFTNGEVSPRLEGRIDLENYFRSLKAARNMNCTVQGNATKRQGTKYLATTKYLDEAIRLIPFEHSSNDTYIIELGDYYMRFFSNGGAIGTWSGSVFTPYEIVAPYTTSQVADVRFVNSADTTYLVHPSVPPQKLIRNAPADWTISTVDFNSPTFLDENETTTTLTPSATTGYITLTSSVSGTFNSQHVGSYWKISGPDTRSGSLTAQNTWVGTIISDIGDDITYSINGTWAGTITLQRSYDQGTTWIDVLAYTSNVALQITTEVDDSYWRIGFKTGGYTSGTAELTIAKVGEYGFVQISDYINSATISGAVIRELPLATATTNWSEGAWSIYRGYPSSVTFFEQRLLFAGTAWQPQTIWGSKVDSYENFETGINDDDSYAYTLASTKINRIRWMLPGEVVYIGTTGSEWKFGSKDTPTTPSYVDAKMQSTWGSNTTQAIMIGSTVFFIQRGSTILRTMVYDYRNENWNSADISKKAEHLLEVGVKVMGYTTRPDSMIWLVMDDGSIVTVTIEITSGESIIAFQKYTTNGLFDDAAIISGDDRDEVWVSVLRTVNSVPIYYIEQFQTALWSETFTTVVPDQVLDIIFDPVPGIYYETIWLTMLCGTPGAVIYYTLNGDEPTQESTRYIGPIQISVATTVRARGFEGT